MKITEHLSLNSESVEPLGANFVNLNLKRIRKDLQESRQPICPYISSTFVDLEEEFKFLHVDTFPKLEEVCETYGSHFTPIDNRRTAVDFRSSSDFCLKNALDNVQNCLPFFICIIGNQYGSHLPSNSPPIQVTTQKHLLKGSTSNERNLIFAATHGHPWVLNVEAQQCSIMELEILASSFSEENHYPKHCYFYFKDYYHHLCNHTDVAIDTDSFQEFGTVLEAESDYAQMRLNDLKLRIVNKGLPVKYFSSKESLGAAILQDWSEVIENLYPLPSRDFVPGDELLLSTWSNQSYTYCHRKKFCFYQGLQKIWECLNLHAQPIVEQTSTARETAYSSDGQESSGDDVSLTGHKLGDGIFSSAASFVKSVKQLPPKNESRKAKIFAIVGDPGSGKSTLLSNWLHEFRKENQSVLVISEFVGSSYLSQDITALCRMCVRILREKCWNRKVLENVDMSGAQTFSGLMETFKASLECHPCVIVIDNINDLKFGMHEDIGKLKGLEWLPKTIPSNCRIVVSTRRSDLTYKALKARDDVRFHWMPSIEVLMQDNVSCAVSARDVLGRDLLDKIWTNRLSERPLFLATLADLLRSCRNERDITQVVDKCTALRIFRDFWKSVFLLWSRRHSWNKQSSGQPGSIRLRSGAAGWVSDSLKMIASARSGLLPHEILHLLSLTGYRGRATVTPHDWNMFQRTAGSALRVGHDGLITIDHDDAKLAINYSLFGGGRHSASSSAAPSIEQRFHLLLGSYFLKYGSMERKLTELPWQLEQGRDFSTLCQVLTKPRFFLAMCEKSQIRPSLRVDHVMHWKVLLGQDFDALQCFKAMMNQASVEPSPAILGPKDSRRASAATQIHDVRRSLLGMTIKAPSMIIITQHEDAPSLYRSTEESRSETEDRDFSETDSFSFFITEPEVEHQLTVGGWNAKEDDPEKLIDTSLLDDDEQCLLHFYVIWFLYQLGDDYHEHTSHESLSLQERLEQSRPLSSSQQLVLFRLIHLNSTISTSQICSAEKLRKALDIFDQLSLRTMDVSPRERRGFKIAKGEISLRLAKLLVADADYEHAHQLIVDSFDIMQKCGSVCGQALAEIVFGALLHSQEMCNEATDMTNRGLSTYLKWHGKKHLDVAFAYSDLAHVYATSADNNQNLRRKAMLALKQALEIFDFNKKKMEGAEIANRIGHLLTAEDNLRSKLEAEECFDRALDAYVTSGSRKTEDVRQMQLNWKQTASDLQLGRFAHGSAKPRDLRSTERPYSSLSWHNREIDKLSVCASTMTLAPSNSRTSDKVSRSGKESCSPRSSRPYSPYSTRSVGNYVLVTPRSQSSRRVKSAASLYSWRGRSVPSSSPLVSDRKDRDQHVSGEAEEIRLGGTDRLSRSEGGGRGPQADRHDAVEGKEVPVIIVPAGRNSRLSVKLDLEEWEKASRHVTDDVDDHVYLTEASVRSESSTTKRSKPTANQRRNSIHQSHCKYRAGPNNLSLSVHGPHSRVYDVLPAPPAPRPVVRSTGICHESAWYHVPGRYNRPGEVLPAKRSQKHPRSEGSLSSRRMTPNSSRSLVSYRNRDDKGLAYPEPNSTRSLQSVMKRQTTSQQSNRTFAELPIYEEAPDDTDNLEFVSTAGASFA